MNNINSIIESQLCYGCGTCNVICNKNAITMKYNNMGRLLPHIDSNLCVNCGLCIKSCPSLDIGRIQYPQKQNAYIGNIINTYIARSNDEIIFKNAQSGGMVTSTLKYLFEIKEIDAAIVCIVNLGVDYKPEAVIVTSAEQLINSQKSSYVPIDMVTALKKCKEYQSIAFVGTGCHIQGINAIKKYKKDIGEKVTFTLGLICDRTLCKTAVDVLLHDVFKNEKKKLIWRDKSEDYGNARVLVTTEDSKFKVIPTWKRFVLKEPFTNPRCRICFDKLNVHADIVFGDPWGMSDVNWHEGASVIITRTKKGDAIISQMFNKNVATFSPASLNEIIEGQHIKERIAAVSTAIKIYKEQKWAVPTYANNLITQDYIVGIDKKIMDLIAQENLSKDQIVSFYVKWLKKKEIKDIAKKCILSPIRFIKFLLTRYIADK